MDNESLKSRLYPLNQLLYRRNKSIRIIRIVGKAVGVMARKHQLVVDVTVMADILQCLLNAERTRVRFASRGAGFILRPVGKLAGRKATHTGNLIGKYLLRVFRRFKNERAVGRAHGSRKALLDPVLRMRKIADGQINRFADSADLKSLCML